MKLDGYNDFIESTLKGLGKIGVDVAQLNLDHIGYQASSNGDYDNLIKEFNTIGRRIKEVIVGGRRVSMYLLDKPLRYKNYVQNIIEVYAPTEGQICSSALEHAEFVIEESFESFMKKYPKLDWNTSAINQLDFPQIKIRLTPSVQVKFHLVPLIDILNKMNR